MHYLIARIQPLPLARLLVDPHLSVIPLETDARLGGLGFTFSKRESQPVPLVSALVDPDREGFPVEAYPRPGKLDAPLPAEGLSLCTIGH